MPRPLVAGNWKMHFTVPEGVEHARRLRQSLESLKSSVDLVVLPPSIMLWEVWRALDGSGITVGAQNASWEDQGAFTGEISPRMLAGWCTYVLLGHSERRQIFGETDETLNHKLRAALRHPLRVILAIGETLEENEAQKTKEVVRRQLEVALGGAGAEWTDRLSIAYEPVWAIGSGRPATPEGANAVMGYVRELLDRLLPKGAERVRIIYGGSVTARNAAGLMAQPNIDGALVGGASLKPDEFTAIAAAAAASLAPPATA
jgi:triosephosphate isomerase